MTSKAAVPQGHEADPFPEYVSLDWGITVACGEGRCDCCPGERWAYSVKNNYRPIGPCTHRCHGGQENTDREGSDS